MIGGYFLISVHINGLPHIQKKKIRKCVLHSTQNYHWHSLEFIDLIYNWNNEIQICETLPNRISKICVRLMDYMSKSNNGLT